MATPAPIDDTDEYTALSRAIHEDGLHLRLGKRWPGVEGLLYRNRAEGKLFRVSILGPSVPAVLAAMDTNYEISREELLGDAPYIRKELANPYDFWHVEFATPADFLLAQKGVEFTTGVYTRSAMAQKYDPPRLGAFFRCQHNVFPIIELSAETNVVEVFERLKNLDVEKVLKVLNKPRPRGKYD